MSGPQHDQVLAQVPPVKEERMKVQEQARDPLRDLASVGALPACRERSSSATRRG
eukprot:CAMPEP_0170137194 /NCGR_PEP_ID=MMETSP0033_2-20121228/3961_1 /TAXON_ID=195969 /ORGANISM="Dolichomastix tenuilepis, Strain CCMP3274" /LENGTH=54 /DNA_ID=CAMNT_0010373031 /DNA_START=65 /DNA_END=226 /DNA_ORIENTATION=-